MARKAMPHYHVWHWNGEAFDLVWHDLLLDEARELATWRNDRAEEISSPNRYVVAIDGVDPVIPT